MKSEKKLLKNTLIYSIGNLGTKLMAFFLVPLYTHYISTADYGTADLVNSTINVLLPIVTLQLNEAIITWMLNEKENKMHVLKCCSIIIFINSVIFIVVYFLLCENINSEWGPYLIILLITKSIFVIFQQYIRGFGRNGLYALGGVLYSTIMLGLNVFLIVYLRMGYESLFISEICSSTIMTIIFILCERRILKSLFVSLDKNMLKEIVIFSLPLIPNALCWSIINVSDRYVVLWALGSSANGILAIAHKFPALIQTITGFFNIAWQESAISEYSNPERSSFYGKVFKKYSDLSFGVALIAISITPFVVELMMAQEYKTAWKYTSFLYVGVVFGAFSSFYNIGYLVGKKTMGALKSTIIAAFVNLIVNFMLIKHIGLYAASFSTMVSYVVLYIVRLIQTKKYFSIPIQRFRFCIISIILIISAFAILFSRSLFHRVLLLVVSTIIALIINKDNIETGMRIVKSIFKR